jgi:acyl transferase domain-containing protein
VVSGPHDAVAALEADLKKNGTAARRLHTSHAFHSSMMDSVVAPFEAMLRATPMSAPQIPYVSNVTAGWITAEEAMHAGYWATHLRDTVRFADGVAELLRDSRRVLLEVGPGRTLTQLATQHPARRSEQIVTSTTSGSRDDERASLAAAVARLWIAGAPIDWAAYYGAERRRRIVLPTYPFEKRRHWPDSAVTLVEPNAPAGALAPTFAAPHADVASLSSTAEAATAMDTSPSR